MHFHRVKFPYSKTTVAFLAGLGGAICIAVLAFLNFSIKDAALLIAPYGATMVLVFGVHQSPLAQPKNVIVGHFVTALVGLIFVNFLPVNPLMLGVAVGVGIFLMVILDVTHPPAGGNPLLIMISGHHSWWFLLHPILLGTLIIVFIGIAYHKCIPNHTYPYHE